MKNATAGGKGTKRTSPDSTKEVGELRERIRELEETIDAIRSGEVDAIVVEKGDTRQIYTLEGADHPYQILVENIREGVLNVSRSGMILYANTRFADMVKLPLDRLPGTSIFDYICPEYCLEIENAVREIQRGPGRIRVRIRHGSSSLPALISMTPLSNDENTKISVVITDRSFDEEQLRLRAGMLDAVGDAVVAADTDNRIIYWNKAATDMYGWTPEKALGHNLVDLTNPEITANEIQAIGNTLLKGEIWSGEYFVHHRDGRRFPVYANAAPVLDGDGNFIAFIGASHDISEQRKADDDLKRKNEILSQLNEEIVASQEELHQSLEELSVAEKLLRESEEKYRIIFETANEGIWITDAERKTILVNQRMADMLGYTVEEMLTKTPSEFLCSDQEQMRQKTGVDLRSGIPTRREFKFHRKDGSDLWVISSASPVIDSKGCYLRTVSLLTDITERKWAEEALRKSEEEYRELISHAPAAIYEISADGLRFHRVNETMCTILGYTESELMEMNPFDILDDESKVRFRERVRKRLSGDDIDESVAYRIIGRDRRTIWVTLNVRLNNKAGGGTLVVAHDVTDRKRAEEALHEAHMRTSSILESIADTFYSLDNQWRFTTVNPAAEKAPFGRPASELLGRVIWELYPLLVETRIHQYYLNAAKKHTLEHYEALSPLNGLWYEVFMQGREGGVDVYMRDISGRKNAETALRESEERFRLALRNAPVSVAVQDHNLVYQWAYNQQTRRPDEIVGKTDADLFAKEDVAWLLPLKRRILESGQEVHTENWVTSNGRRMYLDLSCEPIRGRDGEISGIGLATVDLTDKKLAEEALRESEERFRLALRNAPVSVAIQDTDLVFQWAYNQRTIQPDEVRGKKDSDIFIPEDAARLIELKRACLQTGREIHEKIWITMNGKRLFLDLYLEPLRDGNGHISGIGIATVDLTEQKLIEEALRYSEDNLLQAQELLEAVTKGTDVIIAVQDTNLRYIFFNRPYKREIKRLTGKDLTIGTSMIELFSGIPEEQRREIDEWSKVLNGETVNQTIAFGSPDSRHRRVYHVLH
ncbi:MAG: PAS domain S-box protein, partial [Methanomicrobiales archaeon]|nr:PAS domain S-box protein [Methanomicrobiales archaeon]